MDTDLHRWEISVRDPVRGEKVLKLDMLDVFGKLVPRSETPFAGKRC